MLTGGFERIKAAVSFALKRDDALTLALTAAYKEGAAHDTTRPPTNSDDVLATVKKIQAAKWGQLNYGCENCRELTKYRAFCARTASRCPGVFLFPRCRSPPFRFDSILTT